VTVHSFGREPLALTGRVKWWLVIGAVVFVCTYLPCIPLLMVLSWGAVQAGLDFIRLGILTALLVVLMRLRRGKEEI